MNNRDIDKYLNIKLKEINDCDTNIKLDILLSTVKFDLKKYNLNKSQINLLDSIVDKINTKKEFNKTYKTLSVGEKKICTFLEKYRIKYEVEKEFKGLTGNYENLRFDFYLVNKNICIEYDGIQHFKYVEEFDKGDYSLLEKRITYDKLKDDYCLNNKIELLRIKYTNLNRIEDILYRYLILNERNTKGDKEDLKKVFKRIRKKIIKSNSIKELETLKKEILKHRTGLKGDLKGINTGLLGLIHNKIKSLIY